MRIDVPLLSFVVGIRHKCIGPCCRLPPAFSTKWEVVARSALKSRVDASPRASRWRLNLVRLPSASSAERRYPQPSAPRDSRMRDARTVSADLRVHSRLSSNAPSVRHYTRRTAAPLPTSMTRGRKRLNLHHPRKTPPQPPPTRPVN